MKAVCIALVCMAWLGGCRSEEVAAPEEPEPVVPNAPEAAPDEPEPMPESNFDAFGALIPSDDYVVGVRMPRGATLSWEEPRVHVYQIFAPVDRVLTYFGPLLITGRVEPQGKGAVYRKASVRGAEISPIKVNVSITDIGSGYTRISITEIPPPPQFAPPQDETLRRAREAFRRLD